MKESVSFPHIYVVEASAGSGKTRALSERYVDFLLNPPQVPFPIPFDFRNILAITFTNEAANQMRQRVLLVLKKEALEKGRKKAGNLVDRILRDYSDLRIMTIDSFINLLLIASSLQLKLPPYYEIMPDSSQYLSFALNSLLEDIEAQPKIRNIFLGFMKSYLEIENQRSWYPKRILLNLLDDLHRQENMRAKDFSADLPRPVPYDTGRGLFKTEAQLKQDLMVFFDCLKSKRNIEQRFLRTLEGALDKQGKAFVASLCEIVKKEPHLRGEVENLWKRIKKKSEDYLYVFCHLKNKFYLEVFFAFQERLREVKEKKRIVFLDELNKKAKELLMKENIVAAEIYYKLSAQIFHYLIDEFQDTSKLQWQNIEVLVEDAISKGGSLFYVGDKKQAIYRFRGGDLRLFDQIKKQFHIPSQNLYERKLNFNYRSRWGIVNFNNQVFSQENLTRFLRENKNLTIEAQRRILNVFKGNLQALPTKEKKDQKRRCVYTQIVSGKDRGELAKNIKAKLKETLSRLRKRFNDEDILILMRQNSQVREIVGFLIEENIPVASSRTISIGNNFLIKEIISLLNFLNSPTDNLSFAGFILGDIFLKAEGIKQEQLYDWFETLSKEGFRGSFYAEFRHWQPGVWRDFFEYLFKGAGILPVYDLVSEVYFRFKIGKNFPDFEGFFRHLLEVIKNRQEQEGSLGDFLRWFSDASEEELSVLLPENLPAIKVSTIHKAKGLEANVVILPFVNLEPKLTQRGKPANVVLEDEDKLHLLYFKKEILFAHPHLRDIYQQKYSQAFLDELNCLYVAFTRAKEELHILIPTKDRKENPIISLLSYEQSATPNSF